MIIDSHAYCFPPLSEANGFSTVEEHLRYLQREMADHHQPVWRLHDRVQTGDSSLLADPQDDTLEGLKDVNFRSGGYGRFVWTVDGVHYAKQYLPPYMVDLSHSPDMLVAQMDYLGIDRALLHVNAILGLLNDYHAECVRRYPDRLMALASIREWEIEKDPEAELAQVERGYEQGLHGLQFIVTSRFRYGVTKSWDSDACRPFWEGVTALGKPVMFTIFPPCPGRTLGDYLSQLEIWAGWLQRYPGVPSVLTHGFPFRMFLEDNRLKLPDSVFGPFRDSAAKLQLLFHIQLGDVFDYPYTELHPTIVQLVERLGSDRLMWGTDMPNVERFCNYRQTLDTFRVHCQGLIADEDIQNIIGGTARKLFNL